MSSARHRQHRSLSGTRGTAGTGSPWEDGDTFFPQRTGLRGPGCKRGRRREKNSTEKGVVGVGIFTGPSASCRDVSWEPAFLSVSIAGREQRACPALGRNGRVAGGTGGWLEQSPGGKSDKNDRKKQGKKGSHGIATDLGVWGGFFNCRRVKISCVRGGKSRRCVR